MAENEVLDVGNPRRYQRWRQALADGLSHADTVECLYEDFVTILRNKLRGKPLYLVLKACGRERNALQEAVANFKDRAMAKLVEQAHHITRSSDARVVAPKIAELLIDRLVNRASLYALRHVNADNAHSLEHAASARLEACKPQIVDVLTASLRDEPIRRVLNAPKARLSAEALNARSLLSRQAEEERRNGPSYA